MILSQFASVACPELISVALECCSLRLRCLTRGVYLYSSEAEFIMYSFIYNYIQHARVCRCDVTVNKL